MNTIRVVILMGALVALGPGIASGQAEEKPAARPARFSGKVTVNGKPAKDVLVVLDAKGIEILRTVKLQNPFLVSSLVADLGFPFGFGRSLASSGLSARRQDGPVIWPIRGNKFEPEHLVIQRLQQISTIWDGPKVPRILHYLSRKQPMPSPFAMPDYLARPAFKFHRQEFLIEFVDVLHRGTSVIGYVTVMDHRNYAFSNENGIFGIKNDIPEGRYDLRAIHPRYECEVQELHIPTTSHIEIRMVARKTDEQIWIGPPR